MMSGDEDFKTGFGAGCVVGFVLSLNFSCVMALLTSEESDNTTQLEQRMNELELFHFDTRGELQLLRERVTKLEESEVA